MTTILLFQSL